MRKNILKVGVVLTIILTMTMANFLFLGNSLISYALNDVSTNNQNISFDTYFKDANGNKVETIDKVVGEEDSTIYLYLKVDKEGYFNGKVQLQENSNFTLKEANNEYVNQITDKEIILNQINAGEELEIPVKIHEIKNDILDLGLLNMQSKLDLTGIYKDSTEKDISIEASKQVGLNLISNKQLEANIKNEVDVITNKVIKLNGEEKRVVQLSLNLGLNDNNYPIKNIQQEITVPIINGTRPEVSKIVSTNNMSYWEYSYDGSKVKFNMTNEISQETSNIMWKTTGNEKIILTYIYDKEINVTDANITSQEKVILHDGTESTNTSTITVTDEEKDSIIKVNNINNENSIYKGSIYANTDKQIQTNTKLNLNVENAVNDLLITENESKYITERGEENAEIYYTQTQINKENLINILGEDGKVEILNQNDQVISIIDNLTQAGEDGNIIIKYNDNQIKSLKIKLTGVQQIGSVEFIHTKIIKAQDKEIIRQANAINTKVEYIYNSNQNDNYTQGIKSEVSSNIELKNTVTQANIEINKTNLSVLTKNSDVEIKATLISNSEQNDLYKNPRLIIELPEGISEININSINKLYDDELQIDSYNVINLNNGKKAIQVQLVGEQTKFVTDLSQGIQVIINADITIDKTTPTTQTQLIMNYTNENGTEQSYQTQTDLNLISRYGLIVENKVTGYNDNEEIYTIDNNVGTANIETESTQKQVTVEKTIINNYDKEISNISLIGKIPEAEEETINNETLKSTFVAGLEELNVSNSDAKVYYSTQKDLSADSDKWQESVENMAEVRSFKIEVPNQTLQAGEKLNIAYNLNIPENLSYNESTYDKLSTSYIYEGQNMSVLSATNYETETLTQEEEQAQNTKVEGIGRVAVYTTSAGKVLQDGEEVFEGQTIKYRIDIKNTTDEDISNIKVNVKQTNAIFYDKIVTVETNTTTGEDMEVTMIDENEETEELNFEIASLQAGKTATVEYQVTAKELPGEQTQGTILINADNNEQNEIKTISNNIKEGKIKLKVLCNYNEERELIVGGGISLTLVAKNISDSELKDVILELPIPEGTSFNENYLFEDEGYEFLGNENNVLRFKVKNIAPQEQYEIVLTLIINEDSKDIVEKQINTNFTSTIDNVTYTSNELNNTAYQTSSDLSAVQTGSIESTTKLKTGDKLTYRANISNGNAVESDIRIVDYVPSGAVVNNAYFIKDGQQTQITDINDNLVQAQTTIGEDETIELVIETTIDETRATKSELSNKVLAISRTQTVESNEIKYTLENVVDEKVENRISGLAWLDVNRNGSFEETETLLENIEVRVIDSKTGQIATTSEGTELTTNTNRSGRYEFKNLPNGEYILAFTYDTTKYTVTQYKKSGISEELNSDVIAKQLDDAIYGVTDNIVISDNNSNNINMGLIENQVFDLSLDKYITKITLQSNSGTKVTEYNNEKLAKVEIDAKQLTGTTILVEYTIRVTNQGEIPGYVNEIIDYAPKDLSFNSEINKQWYVSTDGSLHNITLSNETINPGESKDVTLVLMKTITENNTGMTANTAEIAKSSNNLFISDIDSVEANRAADEDDISTAELIVSVRTGIEIAIGTITVIIILGAVAAVVYNIKRKENKNG